VLATLVAQRIASEYQIDLVSVAERKPGEKLTGAHVESHLVENTQQVPGQGQAIPIMSAIVSQNIAHEELSPLTPARRLIGKRMLQSITSAPHIYLELEIDMKEAERCRQSIGRSLQVRREPALSLTAQIVRATEAAIVLHPIVNAVRSAREVIFLPISETFRTVSSDY
jgi:pyruvate dehydrogenase E2 component (dihydrolipoamide acetyltransferase)